MLERLRPSSRPLLILLMTEATHNQLGAAAPIFFRINAKNLALGPQGRKQNIYKTHKAASLRGRRHCEQNIYKTHKAASLAGRKLGSKQMPDTKKNVQIPSKIC
jgi:hypothetical protein